jgi:hypothetical protein
MQTGPGVYLASYTMGARSFPGVKWPGHGVDHTSASSAEVKERVELYIIFSSGSSWQVVGRTLPLPFIHRCVVYVFSLYAGGWYMFLV